MDIKINQLTPITETAPVQETPQGDDSFKFTLLSKIEDMRYSASERKRSR